MNTDMNTTLTRRSFLVGAAAAAAVPAFGEAGKPLKFLFMADHHVESDFIQSFGAEKGEPVYPCWKPGDHAALVKTYEFINTDPFCRDAQFALFGGDQINTGYLSHWKDRDAEMERYHRTLQSLDLYRTSKGTDLSSFKFRSVPSFTCTGNRAKGQAPVTFTCPPLDSRVIAIQGNHDTGVGEFYRECAFQCGGVRFITFFASYVGLPSPRKGVYVSTAKISDEAMAFIEKEMSAAAADPAINHIVLCSHWAIADKGPDFHCPIIGACQENGMNPNRDRLLALCEKYGCDLYINGHEHNGRFPVGKVGSLHDVNCGTPTTPPPENERNAASHGAFALVEIYADRALFHVYSRAGVAEDAAGQIVVTARPRRLFTREIPLKPLRK